MPRQLLGTAIAANTITLSQLDQTVNDKANSAYIQANSAYAQANAAYNAANSGSSSANAYSQANAAYAQANAAYAQANTGGGGGTSNARTFGVTLVFGG